MILNTTQLTVNSLERKITPLATKLRFTVDERIAVRELAATNRYAEDFVDLLNTGYCVDMNRPYFKEGLLFLRSAGILTDERIDQILNSPILETEIYRGVL